MKSRALLSVFALALAACSSACSAGAPQQGTDQAEPTATTDSAIITTTGNVMVWPAGPITWNGLVGTWPINVWAPMPIGALAFGGAGVTGLGITAVGFPSLVAAPITTAYLNAFVPPPVVPTAAATPFFGAAGLNAPAFGFTGTFAPFSTSNFGYNYGAFTSSAALQTSFVNGALLPGWSSAWLNPTLTSSALMFNNLAVLNSFTPYTFNVTFTAQSAAQAAAVQTAAISKRSCAEHLRHADPADGARHGDDAHPVLEHGVPDHAAASATGRGADRGSHRGAGRGPRRGTAALMTRFASLFT